MDLDSKTGRSFLVVEMQFKMCEAEAWQDKDSGAEGGR
jgi:hypothetical protein